MVTVVLEFVRKSFAEQAIDGNLLFGLACGGGIVDFLGSFEEGCVCGLTVDFASDLDEWISIEVVDDLVIWAVSGCDIDGVELDTGAP